MMILDLDGVVFLEPLDAAGRVDQLGVAETRVKQAHVHSAVGADEFGIVEAGVQEVHVDYVGQIRCRYQYRGLDLTDRLRGVIC